MSEVDPNNLANPDQLPGLTPDERKLLTKMFSSPLDIPPEWKAWLISYLEANPPVLPISQIFGFSDFTATFDQVTTKENMPSNGAYVDLATVGPELTALPKGKYVLLFGAAYDASGGATGAMGVNVNGTAPPITHAESAIIEPVAAQRFNLMRAIVKDLSQDSNTIKCQYYSTQSPGPAFYVRWLVALKYQNL